MALSQLIRYSIHLKSAGYCAKRGTQQWTAGPLVNLIVCGRENDVARRHPAYPTLARAVFSVCASCLYGHLPPTTLRRRFPAQRRHILGLGPWL